ncbi:UNVERIFIED_CONTAM: hypothetical protein BEN50_12715 [Euhalothece sp. KZN 001]
MRSPTLVLVIALTILFVSAGDMFLPQPLAKASYRTRTEINEFLLSLFPNPNLEQFQRDRFQKIEG